MWARDDVSVVPGATRSESNGVVWELVTPDYVVLILTGASYWRVMVYRQPGKKGDLLVITPHVFATALEGYDWFMAWIAGDRRWDRTWGTMPEWRHVDVV